MAVRGVEIRGYATLETGPHELGPHFSPEVIRIHPERVHTRGLDDAPPGDGRTAGPGRG